MIIPEIEDAAIASVVATSLRFSTSAMPTLTAITLAVAAANNTIPHPKIPKLPSREDDPEAWSSLIGVITAICGNVLISVALNTQRYAHIKLQAQWEEKRRLLRVAERRRAMQGQGGRVNGNGQGKQSQREQKKPGQNGVDGRHGRQEEDGRDEMAPLLGRRQDTRESDDDEEDYDDSEDAAQKSYLKSPYWWAGIILMTVGEAGNFLAYGFAPASIVSPLGVVAIISNCIIAPFFMGERFRFRDFLGVLISVAGAVTVVLSASENNPKLGPKEIWKLITTWEFETYLGITSLVIVVLMLASNKYGGKSIFIDLGLVGLFGTYCDLVLSYVN
jgi:hypothetical protein